MQEKQTKKENGQFYTTQYAHILQGFHIPDNITHIIEPFAGNGDLLNFIPNKSQYTIQCFDIDPKQKYIQPRNTLLNPPTFSQQFVLTNPPYLAKNKTTKYKHLFELYQTNDLYKCFIRILIQQPECLGGILVVPLNFWCSIRKADVELRHNFLQKYIIERLNIFEEPVFDDTEYTICSFQFTAKKLSILPKIDDDDTTTIYNIPCWLFPSQEQMEWVLCETNHYTVGGEIFQLTARSLLRAKPLNITITNETIPQTKQPVVIYKVERTTRLNTEEATNAKTQTRILVKCLDDTSTNCIKMQIMENETKLQKYVDKTPHLTARSYAVLIITPAVSLEKQHQLVADFNQLFQSYRNKYHSLFLSNYRENNRKRVSFTLVYDLCEYLLVLRQV